MKNFIGQFFLWIYLLVLVVVGLALLAGSVWGAFMGSIGSPWWMLIGGTLLFMIGTWWEGAKTRWQLIKNYAFIYTCTAIIGGYIWLMTTGGDASIVNRLRFTSWENFISGMTHNYMSFLTFPLMVLGTIEALIRGLSSFSNSIKQYGLKATLARLFFS